MKNTIVKYCILSCFLLLSICVWASVQIQPGITLSQGGNVYRIRYEADSISTVDTTLYGKNGGYRFSYVQLLPDFYDYVGNECSPMYPAYTLHLELPLDATNIQIIVRSLHTQTIELQWPYLPVQASITGQDVYVCSDSALYGDANLMNSYYDKWYILGNTYKRLQAKGIDFSIYPVHYFV